MHKRDTWDAAEKAFWCYLRNHDGSRSVEIALEKALTTMQDSYEDMIMEIQENAERAEG